MLLLCGCVFLKLHFVSLVLIICLIDVLPHRLGFHQPPYTSVDHLHLHVLAPASQISEYFAYKFLPKSYRFVTVSATFHCRFNKLNLLKTDCSSLCRKKVYWNNSGENHRRFYVWMVAANKSAWTFKNTLCSSVCDSSDITITRKLQNHVSLYWLTWNIVFCETGNIFSIHIYKDVYTCVQTHIFI